ncbi:hypothetical protein R5R35_005356 [Gryllus longicercus]|uniref:Nucleolar complex protein 2 homolog n=1 Tax=Gryllus longicercus TaxID=2509291 RepID=A0AAN9VDE3_9ORTH
MKPETNIKLGQKKKNALSKQKKADLGAMSVDDFMQSGFDISDESEDERNVDENRNGNIVSSEEDRNDSDSENEGEEEESEDDGEGESEDEDEENDSDIDGLVDDDEEGSEGDEEGTEGDEEGSEGDEEGSEDEKGSEGNEEGSDNEQEGESSNSSKKNKKKVSKNEDDEGDWTSEKFSHKKAVAKLKKSDPEFYKFLQQNDKDLLNFDESDSDTERKGDEEAGGIIHKPPESLEVASDESDYEDGVQRDSRTITLKMVKIWENRLKKTTHKSCETIQEVIHAFHAVLVRVSTEDDDEGAKYVVTGSAVFNAVIQLCVLELQPALKKFLRIPSGKHVDPSKSKSQWTKVSKNISGYISDLVKLLGGVSSTSILAVMLKHLHQMVPFAACFPKLSHPILKKLVILWSTNEDSVRVIAFLCILRLTTHQQNKILEKLLKMMYLSFIRNCKFVSPSTLPAINFMRRSLVEILALDVNVSYQHAFLYIRQLAIHLRNAITVNKKENIQAVYNWQFINSIHLWADLLGATANNPQLQSLVYPLVQVTIGVIKLVPTPQYFPLRFHCTQILIELSKRSCTYIPIMPLLLEVLNTYDFNKRHTKVSMKPMVFTFIVRSSKSDMSENGFKDVIIDTIYKQILEHLSNEAHSISFPDLIIPAASQIKEFLKKCKVHNYCRKMKQLFDKIMENAQVVESERQKVNFKLSDQKSIAAWESQLKLKGTPMSKFYENWIKMYSIQQAKKATRNDEIGDFNLPVLKKRTHEAKPKPEGPVVLFPSDDSDSDVNLPEINGTDEDGPRNKRGKRGSRSGQRNGKIVKPVNTSNSQKMNNVNLDFDDQEDIVEDLKLEDLQ